MPVAGRQTELQILILICVSENDACGFVRIGFGIESPFNGIRSEKCPDLPPESMKDDPIPTTQPVRQAKQ